MTPEEERVEYTFDWSALMGIVRRRGYGVFGHQLSLRELGAWLNVSASTLSRLDRGAITDIATVLAICSVIDEPPGNFFTRKVWVVKSEASDDNS